MQPKNELRYDRAKFFYLGGKVQNGPKFRGQNAFNPKSNLTWVSGVSKLSTPPGIVLQVPTIVRVFVVDPIWFPRSRFLVWCEPTTLNGETNCN